MVGYLDSGTPRPSPKATVEANAANSTLAVANMSKIQTNTGAGAGTTLTLPAASDAAGCAFKVQVTVAQTVTLDPLTGKIFLGGSGVADKNAIIAGVIGNYADVYSDSVDWLITAYSAISYKPRTSGKR